MCRHEYGADRARAEACESSPVPKPLPEGSLVVRPTFSSFELLRIASCDDLVPVAARSPEEVGHEWVYRFLGSPNPYFGRQFSPHRAGVLNRLDNLSRGHLPMKPPSRATRAERKVVDLARRSGMPLDDDAVELCIRHGFYDSTAMLAPLPPDLRAAFSEFEITPAPFDVIAVPPEHGAVASAWEAARALALEMTEGDATRADVLMLCTPLDRWNAEIAERLERWWAGEEVTCPQPRAWRSPRRNEWAHNHVTRHYLTKPQLAIVTATGVEWEKRMNAVEWAQKTMRRLAMPKRPERSPFEGRTVVAVCGGKGGVGKSTVAAALAARIAEEGRTVALVDLDLAGPSQHLIWAVGDVPVDVDEQRMCLAPTVQDRLGVLSLGQLLRPGEELSWDSHERVNWLRFVDGALDLGDTEVVVLDMPPGRSAVYDALLPTVEVHVTTGSPLSIDATRRLLQAPRCPTVVVENMSRGSVHVDDGRSVFGRLIGAEGDVEALATAVGAVYGGSLPIANGAEELAATEEARELAAAVAERIAVKGAA